MTSTVLDLSTMGHALDELQRTYLGDCTWTAVNADQQLFLDWYLARRDEITKLSGLEALAAVDADLLNDFLEARGFDRMFQPITGVGVASVLDMLVEWTVQTTLTKINTYEGNGVWNNYPAFTVPANGVNVYDVSGSENPLVCLHTKTGHKLWLIQADQPSSGISLALTAQKILSAARYTNREWTAGITVPTLEIDTKPDLDWMLNCSAITADGGGHAITQAFQQFKLRLDNTGARVKVATGFATRGAPMGPVPYVFDKPFTGFFTQPGHDSLAIAAFHADTDVWQQPKGDLASL